MTVSITSEGRSKLAPDRECLIFSGPCPDEVQSAYELEAERRVGKSEAIPASGPVRDGNGTFTLYARMPLRNAQVIQPLRDFVNLISRGVA